MSKAADLAKMIGTINLDTAATTYSNQGSTFLTDFTTSINDGARLGNKNLVINGAMRIAQRSQAAVTGLGTASFGYGGIDRFAYYLGNSAGRFTMEQSTDAPTGFQNSMKISCTTADTSIAVNEYFDIVQAIEGQDLQHLRYNTSEARTTVVSFYVKGNAAANYSFFIQYQPQGGTARWFTKAVPVTTSWVRHSFVIPGDTVTGASYGIQDDNNGRMSMGWWFHGGTNYSSGTFADGSWADRDYTKAFNDSQTSFFDSTSRTFFLTGVQFEVGDTVTDFEHEAFSVTLRKCQRYYQKTFVYAQPSVQDPATTGGTISGPAHSDAAYKNICQWWFQEVMRSTPTITTYNPYFSNGNWAKSGYDGPTAGLYSSSEWVCAVRDNGGGAQNTNLQIHADAVAEIN